MSDVLFIIGHPNYKESLANKAIIDLMKEKYQPNAEYTNLSELYPDWKFDVKKEQEKLVKADKIIYQFPMYWHNAPAILRKYIEDVFLHGFAYGKTGDKLKGKKLILSVTTGEKVENFGNGTTQKYTLDQIFYGMDQSAHYAGMKLIGHVETGGISYLVGNNEEKMKELKGNFEEHAKKLNDLINS